MFDEGQVLEHPYYRTKFDAEKMVRESGLRFRIYRPGLVIGSSTSGEADRIDGPYYAFKLIQRLRHIKVVGNRTFGWLLVRVLRPE